MRITIVLAVVTLISFSPRWAVGNQDPLPPVTPETIQGSWESLSEDYERVFRLQLANGSGWLAVGITFIDPMIFALTRTQWHENGVDLYFTGVGRSSKGASGPDDPTPETALVRLTGVAWKDGGREGGLLTGTFVLCPEHVFKTSWKVRFLRNTAIPDVNSLMRLSEQAKQAIEQQEQNPK